MLTFIELKPFAAVRDYYLNDEEFAALQHFLMQRPDAGDVIPHSGGLPEVALGNRRAR